MPQQTWVRNVSRWFLASWAFVSAIGLAGTAAVRWRHHAGVPAKEVWEALGAIALLALATGALLLATLALIRWYRALQDPVRKAHPWPYRGLRWYLWILAVPTLPVIALFALLPGYGWVADIILVLCYGALGIAGFIVFGIIELVRRQWA